MDDLNAALPLYLISDIVNRFWHKISCRIGVSRVGRKKRWNEDMQARFPKGTFERIAALLEKDEDRTDFVREAVTRELTRRERARRGKKAHR